MILKSKMNFEKKERKDICISSLFSVSSFVELIIETSGLNKDLYVYFVKNP